MAQPLFEFRLDTARKLLRVVTRGQWTLADVTAYDAAQRAEIRRVTHLGHWFGDLAVLIDTRGQGPQSQEVIAALGAMLADPVHQARRKAVLMSSALLKLQARRTDSTHGVFDDEAAAIAWLLRPDD